MKKIQRILLVTGFSLIALSVFAQPCVREELQKKTGVWKERIKASTNNVTTANLAKEKEVVQSISSKIKEGYSPVGCEVTHTGEEISEYKNGYYYWESKTEYNPRGNYTAPVDPKNFVYYLSGICNTTPFPLFQTSEP